MEITKRDRDRLWNYGEIMSELGLHVDELDGKTPDDVTGAVRGAVERLRLNGRPGDTMANVGDEMALGGETVEIKYLPVARAQAWRRKYLQKARALDDKYNALAKDLDEKRDAEALMMVQFEQTAEQQELYADVVADYLGREALPEAATEAEISAAMGAITTKVFFPQMGQLTAARRTRTQASGAPSRP